MEHSVHAAPSRHNRWYEKLLLNPVLGHLAGLAILLGSAQLLSYQAWPQDRNQGITLALLASIYLISLYLGQNIAKYAGGRTLAWTLGTTLLSASLVITVILLARIGYARTSLVVGILILMALQYCSIKINQRFRHLKLAVVPSAANRPFPETRNIAWRHLDRPDLGPCRYDGLVVDMDDDLSDEWIRFVSHCSIAGLPVLDRRKVMEVLRGRVDLARLNSADLGNLQPSPVYLAAKRAVDVCLSVLLMPILIPVCLLVALGVKLDSPGPVIFIQKRVGRGNRIFSMYKFRSMRPAIEAERPQFANEDAHRITRFGATIRKFRLDELPQIINVLKGDMSLIGPRPEQPGFVECFEKEVPFYSYRHIIRPGITGWAQVAHGYATDAESTREKVEHDFYYIKNLSPGLDLLIVMRTVKTILTGFGAI